MDFFVRESRAVVEGPMAMVRFGTCGGLTSVAKEGTIVVASGGSGYITRNPDAFTHNYGESEDASATRPAPYHLHKIAPASHDLSELITAKLTGGVGAEHTVQGTNVTAESFYSSQGRLDANFDDENTTIMDLIRTAYPAATTLEMETFMLLHLARCSKVSIKASAAAIVVANRPTGHVIDGTLLEHLESEGGRAILQAITTIAL
eukprot:gene24797-31177_t